MNVYYCTSMIQVSNNVFSFFAEYFPIDGRERLKHVGGLPQVINVTKLKFSCWDLYDKFDY